MNNFNPKYRILLKDVNYSMYKFIFTYNKEDFSSYLNI